MPRKDFVRDLQEAQASALPQNVVSLEPGQDDGSLILLFKPSESQSIQVHVHVSDVGDYPKAHSFFVFTDSEDIPQSVSSTLSEISIPNKSSVSQAIARIATTLNQVIGPFESTTHASMVDGDVEHEKSDSSGEFLAEEEEEDNEYYLEDEEEFVGWQRHPSQTQATTTSTFEQDPKLFADQVRRDLLSLKQAGFRVSTQESISQPGTPCIVMASIRVARLALPEDTLEAWHLQPSEYIMLLLKYPQGYLSLQVLKDFLPTPGHLSMHLLVTQKPKLAYSTALHITEARKTTENDLETAEKVDDHKQTARPLFISKALEELLNSKLVTLIQIRMGLKLDWAGAMSYHRDKQASLSTLFLDISQYSVEEDVNRIENLPKCVQADTLRETPFHQQKELSFPLIAMQFALRHIVRCTEFCLVCFDKTDDDFEALKPYVCSKPLCLFQYMAMGLGPGIEFEILSQKYVVDLLISLCYQSVISSALKPLPVGLGLMVPDPNLVPGITVSTSSHYGSSSHVPIKPTIVSHGHAISGRWDRENCEITISGTAKSYGTSPDHGVTIKSGDWLVFWSANNELYHCQVTAKLYLKYGYRNLIQAKSRTTIYAPELNKQIDLKSELVDVKIVPYSTLFDSLDTRASYSALRMLLDSLPSVVEMANYLRSASGSRGQLSDWTERMTPPAVALLRWIIASNRSCIVYNEKASKEEVIGGMSGYLQFRFVSGSPDKESRFVRNVRQVQARLHQNFPTIFAWHGSALHNWHSIIREGLNFDKIAHGRAYGDGIYHALDARCSIAYTSSSLAGCSWASSVLDLKHLLSLNEIVNAPKEFRCAKPYLVIDRLDWIQTRYLFVKCGKPDVSKDWASRTDPFQVMIQDPEFSPVDDQNKPLIIPTCAISKSRRQAQGPGNSIAGSSKWIHDSGGNSRSATSNRSYIIDISSDSDSSDEFAGIFRQAEQKKKPRDITLSAVTLFQPGRLDRTRLPILASPTYATSASTRALHRELHSVLTEQAESVFSELGWYLDPDHVDNVYQWIVELHSFDKNLPLAKDMLELKIESIVLEVRFGPNFNFSPPFVRVIQPRFLPFAHGGGGHVTAGGALCMELLTSNGWNPSSTMSAVLLQIRMAITSLEPKPARLEGRSSGVYGSMEAGEAYVRACQAHGWKVPDDFRSMLSMMEAPKVPTTPKPGLSRGKDMSGSKKRGSPNDDDEDSPTQQYLIRKRQNM